MKAYLHFHFELMCGEAAIIKKSFHCTDMVKVLLGYLTSIIGLIVVTSFSLVHTIWCLHNVLCLSITLNYSHATSITPWSLLPYTWSHFIFLKFRGNYLVLGGNQTCSRIATLWSVFLVERNTLFFGCHDDVAVADVANGCTLRHKSRLSWLTAKQYKFIVCPHVAIPLVSSGWGSGFLSHRWSWGWSYDSSIALC